MQMKFIFFKQKTAYEIMSGDWSSDVCSSDLFPSHDITQDNRNVKKALQEEFKNCKISVNNGRGTAWGWKEIRIETDQQFDLHPMYLKAFEIVRKVSKKIYTYLSDDNEDRECVLISIVPK